MLTIGSYVIGKFFFDEQLTPIKVVSLGLAMIGLFVIYRFSLTPEQFIPAISMMIAGLMGSTVVVFSKKISSYYSEVQILTNVFAVMLVANLILSWLLGETMPALELSTPWLAELGYAATMLIANTAVVAGYKQLEPSVGGVLGLLEVVFAAFLGVVIFQEAITPSLIAGSVLIIAGAGMADAASIVKKMANTNKS